MNEQNMALYETCLFKLNSVTQVDYNQISGNLIEVLLNNYESYKYLLKCELNEFISRNELMRKILLSSFDDQTLKTKIKYLEEDSIQRNCLSENCRSGNFDIKKIKIKEFKKENTLSQEDLKITSYTLSSSQNIKANILSKKLNSSKEIKLVTKKLKENNIALSYRSPSPMIKKNFSKVNNISTANFKNKSNNYRTPSKDDKKTWII